MLLQSKTKLYSNEKIVKTNLNKQLIINNLNNTTLFSLQLKYMAVRATAISSI
jgi:hypothetical protein